jgi:hypothetical protein
MTIEVPAIFSPHLFSSRCYNAQDFASWAAKKVTKKTDK